MELIDGVEGEMQKVRAPRRGARGQQGVKPSFLFVGTGRAGSNWVFEVLREHPEVVMPRNKGTFFFNRNFDRGVDWYESFFRYGQVGQVGGEVCEDYLCDVDAMERIFEYRRDMRLICCFRNPYERALSHWRFFGRNGLAESTLIEQGRRRPDLYYLGYYATQLRALWGRFSKEHVLVYLYEDLVSDPEKIVSSIYKFIAVDQRFLPRSTKILVNAGAEPRVKLVARMVHELHMRSWGESRFISNLTGSVKRVQPLRGVVKALLYKRPVKSAGWRDSLAIFPSDILARYEQEILELEDLLGRDLSHWHAPRACVQAARLDSGAACGQEVKGTGNTPAF